MTSNNENTGELVHTMVFEGSWGQPQGPNFPSP